MIKKDLHTHTTYCDGKNTPEEMILAAIDKGLAAIGISGHSYLPFDNACMKEESIGDYIREVKALKEKYKDRIEVLLGLEKDYFSKCDLSPYDYVIGSVHFIEMEGDHICVDYDLERLKACVKKYFNGDYLSYAEKYYETIADMKDYDIVGHFDIVTKFNEQEYLIDVENERYKKAWKKAADKLLNTGAVFEVNVGAISRGYRSTPYPSKEIIDYLKEKGGKLILSSDAHNKENIAYRFDEFEEMIKD